MTTEKRIALLLREIPLEEVLDHCDITAEEVLEFLVETGRIELPEWTPEI